MSIVLFYVLQLCQYKNSFHNDSEILYQLLRKLLHLARNSQNNNVSLAALKCLGEIGPLYLEQKSYYFDASNKQQDVSPHLLAN